MPLGKAYLVDTCTYYKSLFFIFKPFKATFLNPHLFPSPPPFTKYCSILSPLTPSPRYAYMRKVLEGTTHTFLFTLSFNLS